MDCDETGQEDMNWIDLAQCRDKWQAVVNEVMNLQVLQNAENYPTS
jgi:hypothetical protein